MKRKLSNQFLANYLVVFLLTVAASVIAISLLSLSSGLISDTLAKNRFPADSIMKDDYTKIDTSSVIQNGGGVQIVDKEYRIVYSGGVDTIQKNQLSVLEWTDFLVSSQSKDTPYHYDILYNSKGEFWMIVTFPTSIRIDFAVVSNKEASSGDFALVKGVIAAAVIFYLLLLALFSFIYSRMTASGITGPLRKLCEGTRLLREGDYSVRVDLRLKNEFAELQDTFNDMAARIEHEMALRKQSENDRRRLILDISHDLKNPLASVSGYAELCLKQAERTQEETNTYLQVIYNNSQRANLLLTELFELSRLDSPEFSLTCKKTDLCEYLRQACGDLLPSLESSGFKYEFDIPPESIYVMLDPDRFIRIFQNLTENAIRYNSPGTTLSISLSVEMENAVILFQDDGRGIPGHLAENIFKPFVRADHQESPTMEGSGLGLSIAKKIAVAHNGDLTLRANVKQGCAFAITIPLI